MVVENSPCALFVRKGSRKLKALLKSNALTKLAARTFVPKMVNGMVDATVKALKFVNVV